MLKRGLQAVSVVVLAWLRMRSIAAIRGRACLRDGDAGEDTNDLGRGYSGACEVADAIVARAITWQGVNLWHRRPAHGPCSKPEGSPHPSGVRAIEPL